MYQLLGLIYTSRITVDSYWRFMEPAALILILEVT
jgi:hypothetical protein